MSAVARNLGLVMRRLFGFGTARSLQAAGGLADALYLAWLATQAALKRLLATENRIRRKSTATPTTVLALALAA